MPYGVFKMYLSNNNNKYHTEVFAYVLDEKNRPLRAKTSIENKVEGVNIKTMDSHTYSYMKLKEQYALMDTMREKKLKVSYND